MSTLTLQACADRGNNHERVLYRIYTKLSTSNSYLRSPNSFLYMKQGFAPAREHGGSKACASTARHHWMLYRTSEWTLTAFLGMGTRTTTFVPAAVSGMSALTITTTSILHARAVISKEREKGERGKKEHNKFQNCCFRASKTYDLAAELQQARAGHNFTAEYVWLRNQQT